MITERQTQILEFVIREYVESAVPVGSQLISRQPALGVSPATIRSEMAELEEQGYLGQPHTSAGRVPTERGYRYYVETLMREEELPSDVQRTIRHQFHQAEEGQEEWVHLAASVLARTVENAAVVTAPRTAFSRIKHLQLVSLQEHTALLVVVLDQARLKQQILGFEKSHTQKELGAIADRLNHAYAGCSARELASKGVELTRTEGEVLDAVKAIMAEVDAGTSDEAYLEGVRHILSQPEFVGSERVLDLLELLDERNLARSIPFRALAREGVTVIIGADNPRLERAGEAMRECSVILGSYGAEGVASGALAVLGPMRMRYSHTISAVRYLAAVMSELLSEHYEPSN